MRRTGFAEAAFSVFRAATADWMDMEILSVVATEYMVELYQRFRVPVVLELLVAGRLELEDFLSLRSTHSLDFFAFVIIELACLDVRCYTLL
jgi:hypothetical protein